MAIETLLPGGLALDVSKLPGGFYWVSISGGEPMIAEWHPRDADWYPCGCECLMGGNTVEVRSGRLRYPGTRFTIEEMAYQLDLLARIHNYALEGGVLRDTEPVKKGKKK